MHPRPLLIGGTPVSTSDVREIRSPWDGAVKSRVCWAGAAEVEQAIALAHATRGTMAGLPAHRRAEILEAARDGLRARRDELVAAVVDESGKPITAARGEVDRATETFTDAAWAARAALGSVEPLDALPAGAGRIGLVQRVPVGVVSAITPFNFPVNLVAHKLAPAIAAGCPVVLKPAPEAPTAALMLAEILHEAGLPAGGLSVVPCDVDVAAPLSSDPRLAFLSFTGSAKVGWALKARAAHMKVALELGGNAGVYVAADADLALAVERIAWGGFVNAGQTCIHVQRVLVHASLYEAFLEALVTRVRDTVKAGSPYDADVLVGPLIRARDAERVLAWIDEARAAGATVHTGGTRSGQVVSATVLSDAPTSCAVEREEVFGPVVSVRPVANDEEALAALDASAYGLQAGIFTRDVGLLMRAWHTLHVGGIIHDDASTFRVDSMPYGGVKDSGIGREGPRHAVLELTEPRILVLRSQAAR